MVITGSEITPADAIAFRMTGSLTKARADFLLVHSKIARTVAGGPFLVTISNCNSPALCLADKPLSNTLRHASGSSTSCWTIIQAVSVGVCEVTGCKVASAMSAASKSRVMVKSFMKRMSLKSVSAPLQSAGSSSKLSQNSPRPLLRGKGVAGTGTFRKSHKGPQPSDGVNTNRRSAGTRSRTRRLFRR